MTDSETGPAAMPWWDSLVADAERLGEEYREQDWTATVLHTADVTPLDGSTGDRVGLSVLVPDDEFETVTEDLAGTEVTRYEAYRTTVPGYVTFVLAVETAAETALLCPGYYSTDDDSVDALFERAVADGSLTVYLRRLDDAAVELTLTDPALLAPEEAAGPDSEAHGDGSADPGD